MSHRISPSSACFLILAAGLVTTPLAAQRSTPAPSDPPAMFWEEYEPRSTLVVPENPVPRARYPVIDVHSHQRGDMPRERLDQLVADMDALNLQILVNLSGGTGERLAGNVDNMEGPYPDRFVTFANVDFSDIDDPEFGRKAASRLERDFENGARGLKIFKNLGLTLKDGTGARVPTDDPRLEPIWEKAGELGIPVLIHTGEPAQFFDPHDQHNERWLELKERPGRARPPSEYPPWETVMEEQWRMFRKHPRTTFIAAHLAWLGGDLGRLGKLLDEIPNMHTEIGAVLAELGRQPQFARRFLETYQDRVMFGKDSWRPEEYPYFFRTLETADEYFPYYRKRHAFWRLYGLDLPEVVLKKLYYGNALKLIPGIAPTPFPPLE